MVKWWYNTIYHIVVHVTPSMALYRFKPSLQADLLDFDSPVGKMNQLIQISKK